MGPAVETFSRNGRAEVSRIADRHERTVVETALARRPEDRFGSCRGFVDALRSR